MHPLTFSLSIFAEEDINKWGVIVRHANYSANDPSVQCHGDLPVKIASMLASDLRLHDDGIPATSGNDADATP